MQLQVQSCNGQNLGINKYNIKSPGHLDTLSAFAGTKEIGNNAGPKLPILKALRYMGFGKGTPYCAVTLSWCLEITDAKRPDVRTALATDFIKSEDVVLAKDVLRKRDTAEVGWGVIWRRGNGYHGHAGFADSTWTGRCGWTIEANTTIPGTDTQGITRKKRCIDPSAHFSIVAFIPTTPEGRTYENKNCDTFYELIRESECKTIFDINWYYNSKLQWPIK